MTQPGDTLPGDAITEVAVMLHDFACPDRCEPQVMGAYYRRARKLLEAAAPVLEAKGAAAERARIAHLLLDDGWPRMQLERLGLLDGGTDD